MRRTGPGSVPAQFGELTALAFGGAPAAGFALGNRGLGHLRRWWGSLVDHRLGRPRGADALVQQLAHHQDPLAVWCGDLDPGPGPHQRGRLDAVAIDLHVPATARLLRLGAALELPHRPEPDVDAHRRAHTPRIGPCSLGDTRPVHTCRGHTDGHGPVLSASAWPGN